MTDRKTMQSAIDELIGSYMKTFGETPDNVTGMVIRTSAKRVADGEWFKWVQDGAWRKIVWRPTDE